MGVGLSLCYAPGSRLQIPQQPLKCLLIIIVILPASEVANASLFPSPSVPLKYQMLGAAVTNRLLGIFGCLYFISCDFPLLSAIIEGPYSIHII